MFESSLHPHQSFQKPLRRCLRYFHATRYFFGLLFCATLAGADGTVSWQQAGGTLSSSPTFKGIVSQGYETPLVDGGSTRLQAGFLSHPLLVNNAPFVTSPLADLSKLSGFTSVVIPLISVFADADGDALTYSVTLSGSSATAVVSGDSLILSGVSDSSGLDRVVVSASDGSYTARDTFSVTVSSSAAGISDAPPSRLHGLGALSVSVPQVFARVTSGVGPGVLGSVTGLADDQSLSVNLLLPSAGNVSVHIFDQLGTPVISFSRRVSSSDLSGLVTTSEGQYLFPVTWNLRAANGVAVPAGVYLWKIEVVTVDGQKLETIRRLGVKGAK